MRILIEQGAATADVVAAHVAVPDTRPHDRAFVRLNMISSADGGTAVEGISGGLGNRDDHEVFAALRAAADVVVVGLGTVVAEKYHATPPSGPELYVVADIADISGDMDLFESGRATLVLPEGVPAPSGDVPVLRAGSGPHVDLVAVAAALDGKVVLAEGGPTVAGALASLGLLDEFFLTLSPRVIAGASPRVVHGEPADPEPWELRHGFVDDEGFLFLRYARPSRGGRE
jgi:riboflavin biosynthesis pyrimidine reductase